MLLASCLYADYQIVEYRAEFKEFLREYSEPLSFYQALLTQDIDTGKYTAYVDNNRAMYDGKLRNLEYLISESRPVTLKLATHLFPNRNLRSENYSD